MLLQTVLMSKTITINLAFVIKNVRHAINKANVNVNLVYLVAIYFLSNR